MLFISKSKETVEKIERSLKELRDQVYTELDEHREGINEQTVELSVNGSRLDDIEHKLDVLSQRLERLTSSLEQKPTASSAPLTIEEQQVFLALYMDAKNEGSSIRDLALRSGVALSSLPSLLESMSYKSIPVVQEFVDGECKIKLESYFKRMHTKHNVVTISEVARANAHTCQHVTLDRFGVRFDA